LCTPAGAMGVADAVGTASPSTTGTASKDIHKRRIATSRMGNVGVSAAALASSVRCVNPSL
jgi:hypothetical protein